MLLYHIKYYISSSISSIDDSGISTISSISGGGYGIISGSRSNYSDNGSSCVGSHFTSRKL